MSGLSGIFVKKPHGAGRELTLSPARARVWRSWFQSRIASCDASLLVSQAEVADSHRQLHDLVGDRAQVHFVCLRQLSRLVRARSAQVPFPVLHTANRDTASLADLAHAEIEVFPATSEPVLKWLHPSYKGQSKDFNRSLST